MLRCPFESHPLPANVIPPCNNRPNSFILNPAWTTTEPSTSAAAAPTTSVTSASIAIIDAVGRRRQGKQPASTQLSALAPVFTPAARAPDPVKNVSSHPTPVSELYTAFYCNARSLRNNLAELHATLYSGNYKILCFTETWLCSYFNDAQLDPQGLFNIYRRDRKSQRPAGGVCIFISKNFHSMLSEISLSEFEDAEVVAVKVLTGAATHVTFICAYISPNSVAQPGGGWGGLEPPQPKMGGPHKSSRFDEFFYRGGGGGQ